MIDEYFGVKELNEVVLKAKTPMIFGNRQLEIGEPVMYFENISMSLLTEQSHPIMARGGWGNMPHVIWEDRSEVQFTINEGVMSAISMGILFSAGVTGNPSNNRILVPQRDGPFILDANGQIELTHKPYLQRKVFIYEYERDVAQKKVYGKVSDQTDTIITVYQDKVGTPADITKQYIVDYYYEYTDEALIYTIQKERFKGLFTLEGKFYAKDENDGINYTNLMYMPKVRVVSDINLRLGERADPTVAVFNIIGMPENTVDENNLILKIVRLGAVDT